ncbi:MAG TPA: sigma-70 family RNA polymerase sigma factor, partial [Ilumatobacteraceae bacterium]|nr:sigma-70 family RNA polymerase sigma factor [Ilumatobacteraceae bacterium]
GWAIATCRSRFIDQLRRAEVEGRALRRVEQRPQPSSANSGAFDALAQVPDNQRTALILRYVDDLTVAQVAREMKRSVRATESLLSRGRDSLRTAYGEGAQ